VFEQNIANEQQTTALMDQDLEWEVWGMSKYD
jgi:hypothetical protein